MLIHRRRPTPNQYWAVFLCWYQRRWPAFFQHRALHLAGWARVITMRRVDMIQQPNTGSMLTHRL